MRPFDPSDLPRFVFFTGKGGVGKTTLAAATALRLADSGRRVALVSTDPASNLPDVLGSPVGAKPMDVTTHLTAVNIDPVESARQHRERLLAPLRDRLPAAALRGIEESLSGSCTVEIAAFDEFAAWVAGDRHGAFDHVVFDTAPTGHTLRLMGLARAWDSFLTESSSASCLGPLAGLEAKRDLYGATVRTLADGSLCGIVLVARAGNSSLREARRASEELAREGLRNQTLVLNARFRSGLPDDEAAAAWMRREEEALAGAEEWLASRDVFELPLRATSLLGLAGLRALWETESLPEAPPSRRSVTVPDLDSLVEEIAAEGRGLVLLMGKGGVGKTTLAAAIALALAARGHDVHLTTTDPAAHLDHVLPAGDHRLSLGRIDPLAETEAYRSHVLETSGLDPAGRALLAEDLASPCTEEVAVFRAFAREAGRAETSFVLLDTAPTGHTLLLLDSSQSYHRELERQSRSKSTALELLPRLRDPRRTKVLLVTLAETTPVNEAAALQEDLRRAGIEPFGWIINATLARVPTADPFLAGRADREAAQVERITSAHSLRRTALVDWRMREPVGPESLTQLLHHV